MQHDYYILAERRKIWASKTILKRLYQKWCHMIGNALTSGSTLEVGAGSGPFKEFFPDAISTDILSAPWLDAVLDAHFLPFKDGSLNNIVLFDVLHHLQEPVCLFSEAQRVLKTNGKIILLEPYISWASFLVYRLIHHEEMTGKIDPFKPSKLKSDKHHFQGNQAIPTLMFEKDKKKFMKTFPHLTIIKEERIDFLLYPLSGGFHYPSFCPAGLYPVLEYLEKLLNPFNRLLAFRLFVVLEKT